MPVIIKGTVFGQGRPIVCVPITETDKDSIIDKARLLVTKKVKMIEWRADCYEDVCETEELKNVLQILRGMTGETILLVTMRTKQQGGKLDVTEDQLERLLKEVADARCADIIDVEYFSFEHAKDIIGHLQMQGANVIASHHDFNETPSPSVMNRLLDEMMMADADMVKLAVMPQRTEDVIALLTVSNHFHKNNPHMPLIAISMGDLGLVSRIAGETFGSSVTFASMGEQSAPGQIPYKTLNEVLDTLHTYGQNA